MLNSLVNTKLNKRVDSHLNYHGLSFTDYMIIHHLFSSSQKCMRRIDLAECVGISASGVTRLLSPMQKVGIVEKQTNPRDARVSLVKLTAAGESLYKDATVSFTECSKNLLQSITDIQLNTMSDLIKKLI